jgi:hypothetical protein
VRFLVLGDRLRLRDRLPLRLLLVLVLVLGLGLGLAEALKDGPAACDQAVVRRTHAAHASSPGG